MGFFASLRAMVDPHRAPLSHEALRQMAGASTFVHRATEQEAAPRLAATMYPLPAGLPFWEPLRDTHFLYVPGQDTSEVWPFVLRVMDAQAILQRPEGARLQSGCVDTARAHLLEWIEKYGSELPDSRLRRLLRQCSPAESMFEEDQQFLALAALAEAAQHRRWILWDPFRNRAVGARCEEGDNRPTLWFLRTEAGEVGVVVPYRSPSPTCDPAYGRDLLTKLLAQRLVDQDELRRLEHLSAVDLKAHFGSVGRTKKAGLIRDWYERPRWNDLDYDGKAPSAALPAPVALEESTRH